MKSAEYEKVVSDLVADLVQEIEGLPREHVGSGEGNRLPGASGHPHQIDVSFEVGAELHLIECKNWNGRIPVRAVLTLFARLHDIQAANPSLTVRATLVTKKGVHRGAEKVASHYGIALWVVQSSSEFALRYKNHIHLGRTDRTKIAEAVTVKLFPARCEQPDSSNHVA